MQVFHTPITRIDKAEIRRYAGLRGETTFPDALLEKACTEALVLVKTCGCWENYRYNAATGTIEGSPGFCLNGVGIRRHLAETVEVAVLAVSIGPGLEEEVSARFAAGDYAFGLLLDAAGTTAVEAVADTINSLIADQAARRGLTAISRFSPGYGDWKVTDQPQILKLSGGQNLDIHVTTSCILVPRKSVTAVVGLVNASPDSPVTTCKPEGCKVCLQPNCPARKENL